MAHKIYIWAHKISSCVYNMGSSFLGTQNLKLYGLKFFGHTKSQVIWAQVLWAHKISSYMGTQNLKLWARNISNLIKGVRLCMGS